jgi:hypothetical protein
VCPDLSWALSLDTIPFRRALNPNLAREVVHIVNILQRFIRPLRLVNRLRFAVDGMGVDRTMRGSCECGGNRRSPRRRPVQKGEKGEDGCATGLWELRCKANQAAEPD